MANKIILKKSSVASKVPLTSDLEYGELALNYADGVLYYKNASNTISAISTGSGGGGGSSVTVSTTPPILPAAGDLWWNSEEANLYIYYADGDSSQWVTASRAKRGEQGLPGVVTVINIDDATGTNFLEMKYDPATGEIVYEEPATVSQTFTEYVELTEQGVDGTIVLMSMTDTSPNTLAALQELSIGDTFTWTSIYNPDPEAQYTATIDSEVIVDGGVFIVEVITVPNPSSSYGNYAYYPLSSITIASNAAPTEVPIDITTTPPTDGQALIWDDANSKFVPGDVSSGGPLIYNLEATTTDATETELFIGGVSGQRVPVATDKTIYYTIDLVARRTNGNDFAAITLKGVASNTGDSVIDIGSIYEIIVVKTDGSITVDARADDTNNSIGIYVTGIAEKTFAWKAQISVIEV